ncbi:glycosyltransferase [Echinicola sediminis]
MNLFALFLFTALAIYLAILVVLSIKWRQKMGVREEKEDVFDYPVSLLVPFRNERENLPELLENLAELSYQSLEVVLIDDQSEDGGGKYVREWIRSNGKENFKLIKSEGEGKKAAVEHGVVVSEGRIILTTDADCLLPVDWVQMILQPFRDPKVQMVAGPVMSKEGKTEFEHFQQIDWAGILLMTNFFFQIKRPVMCSGANMGYRKEAFYHLRGYEGNAHLLSGDDSFLLEKMYDRFGGEAITFCTENKLLVKTSSANSWKAFVAQRKRWARKWNKHRLWQNAYGAVASTVLSLSSLSSIILLFGGRGFPLLFVLFWGLKFAFEYVVLGQVLKGYRVRLPVLSFVYASFCHPFYVVLVAISSFFGHSSWKGR